MREMLQAGVDGYVVKSAAVSELVQAIRAVQEGRMYLSPAIARLAIGKAPAAQLARLSHVSGQFTDPASLVAPASSAGVPASLGGELSARRGPSRKRPS